jgi:hypothetical protein
LSADILANSEQFTFAAIQMDGQGFLFLKGSIEAYQSPDHILAKKYFISGKLGKHLKCKKCHSHIYISNLCNSKYVKCTRRPAGTSTDLSKERQHRYIPTYFHNVRICSRKTKMQN